MIVLKPGLVLFLHSLIAEITQFYYIFPISDIDILIIKKFFKFFLILREKFNELPL